MPKTYVVAPNFRIPPPPEIPKDPPPVKASNDTNFFGGLFNNVTAFLRGTDPAYEAPPRNPFNSDAGPIQLGDLLKDPFGAEWIALNREARKPIDGGWLNDIDEKNNESRTYADLFNGRLGVFASLLAKLGIGTSLNIGIHWERKSDIALNIESLETHAFDPRQAYIESVVASSSEVPEFKKWLKNNGSQPLYMVSGLMIAKGAKMTSASEWQIGGNAGASDATGHANLDAIKILRKRARSSNWEAVTKFILAAQLHEITLSNDGSVKNIKVNENKASVADGSVTSGFKASIPVVKDISGTLDVGKTIFENVGGKYFEAVDSQTQDRIIFPYLEDEEE